MNYQEEIQYRDEILQRAYKGIKPTPEERIWCSTHSAFNWKLGYPYYVTAVEKLGSCEWHILTVEVESVHHEGRILPVIGVPAGKGKIIADFEVRDFSGKKSIGKPIKLLGIEMSEGKSTSLKYCSDYGLFFAEYECSYYDEKMRLNKTEISDTSNALFAMTREALSDNKVRYRCKSPLSDKFDAMVFTVEWKAL